MRVMIRSRVEIRGWLKRWLWEPFSDPWHAGDIDVLHLPRIGEQFITPYDRAFAVSAVEWRYDIEEVHLFCIEYPRDPDAELEVPDDSAA